MMSLKLNLSAPRAGRRVAVEQARLRGADVTLFNLPTAQRAPFLSHHFRPLGHQGVAAFL
jgi:hypothetical protein